MTICAGHHQTAPPNLGADYLSTTAQSSPGRAEGRAVALTFLILLFFQCPCTQGLLRTWKSASQPDCSWKVALVPGRSLGQGVRVQLMQPRPVSPPCPRQAPCLYSEPPLGSAWALGRSPTGPGRRSFLPVAVWPSHGGQSRDQLRSSS